MQCMEGIVGRYVRSIIIIVVVESDLHNVCGSACLINLYDHPVRLCPPVSAVFLVFCRVVSGVPHVLITGQPCRASAGKRQLRL